MPIQKLILSSEFQSDSEDVKVEEAGAEVMVGAMEVMEVMVEEVMRVVAGVGVVVKSPWKLF